MKHLQCAVIGNSKLTKLVLKSLLEMGQFIELVLSTNNDIIELCQSSNVEVAPKTHSSINTNDLIVIAPDEVFYNELELDIESTLLTASIPQLSAFSFETTEVPYKLIAFWHFKNRCQAKLFSKSFPLTRDMTKNDLIEAHQKLLINLFEELIVALSKGHIDELKTKITYDRKLLRLSNDILNELGALSQELSISSCIVLLSLVIIFFSRYFVSVKLAVLTLGNNPEKIKEYVGSICYSNVTLVNIDFEKELKEQVRSTAKYLPNTSSASLIVDKNHCPKIYDNYKAESKMHFLSNCFFVTETSIFFYWSNEYLNQENVAYIFDSLLQYINSFYKNRKKAVKKINILSNKQTAFIRSINDNFTCFRKEENNPKATFLDLFDDVVQKHPKGIAIECSGRKLCYEEFSMQANAACNYLLNKGIKPKMVLAIALPKSESFFIAIMAIFKCNCTFLPIDVDLPKSRIDYLLNNAKCNAIITEKKLHHLFLNQSTPIVFSDHLIKDNRKDKCFSEVKPEPDDCAYLIYTSGTSGEPKGVVIKHRGLKALALTQITNLKIKNTSRLLQFANLSFDASILDWSIAFASGATLVINNKTLVANELIEFVESQSITYMHLPPTVLNMCPARKVRSLEVLVVGGENCSQKIVDNWIKYTSVFNSYGPTENTVCSLMHKCDQLHSANTIGKPLNYVNAYVIDKFNMLSPPLVYGELLLAGEGLSPGYLDSPDLSKEKFIKLENIHKGILYRTGDIVMLNHDGTHQYSRRVDNQIKIRGYRVELCEIERVAEQHENLKQAVALVRGEREEATIVLYYLCLKNNTQKSLESSIRAYLKKILPVYMIPNYFIQLASFPMTANGKIDIEKLSLISPTHQVSTPFFPKDKIDDIVLDIFLSTLKITSIEEADDFLMLGGNSLRAVHLLAAIEEKLSTKIPIDLFFKTPTIRNTVNYIKSIKVVDRDKIHICDRSLPSPLSYSQNRLWYLYELEDRKSLAYNVPTAYKIVGRLQIDLFKIAFNHLIERHEILRTVFQVINGKAYQLVLPKYNYQIINKKVLDEHLFREISAEVNKPFDIMGQPPFRSKIFQTSEQTFVFLLLQHNIITDGWSIGVFLKELGFLYKKALNITKEKLIDLKYQYIDYCHWQNKNVSSEGMTNQINYWVENLRGFSELNMPTNYPRPHIGTTNGECTDITINNFLMSKLVSLAKDNRCSLYMVLLSGFSLLLNKYSGQDDFVIGTGTASRSQLFHEGIMGFFVNTLPIRIRIDKGNKYIEFLDYVKRICLGAYKNQDVPFDLIVKKIGLIRELDRSPLFQVMFMFQDASNDATLDLYNLQTQKIDVDLNGAMFDLTFDIYKSNESIKIRAQYNTDLYHKDTVHSLLERLIVFLENITDNPLERIENLRMTTSDERHALINKSNAFMQDSRYEFNATGRTKYRDLKSLLIDNLISYFGRDAIKYRGQILSYEKLDKYSNQFSRKILKECKNIDPANKSILVIVDKNIDYVIILLAILKLGASYIPVNPEYPDERIKLIINDASPIIIVATQNDRLSKMTKHIPVVSHGGFDHFSHSPTLGSIRKANSVCYIMYTSGSAGFPKGVPVRDSSLCNLLLFFEKILNFKSGSNFLSVTSTTFDISALEIFLPLITGGGCIITPESILNSPDKMLKLIKTSKPTHIQATPSLWELLLSYLEDCDILKKVVAIVGGEPLNKNLAEKMLDKLKCVINAYGPTETTIWSTYNKLTCSSEYDVIGKPVANTVCYVLDQYGDVLPDNIPGELFIGGEGVANTYLNDDELTNRQFISNSFNQDGCLFKTGDLVYLDSKQRLHYIGRNDSQVKVRGYRVETKEIESVAMQYKGVDRAVTIAEKNTNDNSTILSLFFTTVKSSNTLLADELAEFLSDKLPRYMLPNRYTRLNCFPLSNNGKINRNALKDRNECQITNDTVSYLPESEYEIEIFEIFCTILGVEKVGCNENFFLIGGHSLLVPQVILEINNKYSISLTIRDFINNPSVLSLAKFVSDR